MGKSTLVNVLGRSFFLSGRLSVGVYNLGNQKCVLFDSGIDADNAKLIDKTLLAEKLRPIAIINTHSHADHCGGNAYFQKAFPDIQIFATKYEKVFIEQPELEPICFCGGASPFDELRNKHFEAKPSVVTHELTTYVDQQVTIDSSVFRIVTVPGHTSGMIAVITPDGVLYGGDALFGEETFHKHGVLFYTDITATINTFEKLSRLEDVTRIVLYHGGIVPENQSLAALAELHKTKIVKTASIIEDMVLQSNRDSSLSIDDLTELVSQRFSIPDSVGSYILTRTCVNAYVRFLQLNKRLALNVSNGKLSIASSPCLENSQKKTCSEKITAHQTIFSKLSESSSSSSNQVTNKSCPLPGGGGNG